MEREFVPYAEALDLKELGFECDYYFLEYDTEGYLQQKGLLSQHNLEYIIAPLYQQAFRFFRENHELLNHITSHLNPYGEDGALEESYGYRIMINRDGWKCNVWEKLSIYDSYEEAELECLRKLIEIVKQSK